MSQILIIQGRDGNKATALFQQGLSLFESLFHLQPTDVLINGMERVGVFPPGKSPGTGILRAPARSPASPDAAWVCGAGVWFVDGVSREEGLRKLMGRPLEQSFQTVDGCFAIAHKDGPRTSVLTDRLGAMHVYTMPLSDCIAICTSSMVLAALGRPNLDMVACREFLATGTIFESRTPFAGIEKLPPAQIVEFEGGRRIAQRKYWNIADVMWDRSPQHGGVESLAATLKDALTVIVRNYPNPLLDLTGGFDSRAVLGAALQADIRFETVVNGPENNSDVRCAQHIADHLGLRHHHNFRQFNSVQEWWDKSKAAFSLCDGEYDPLIYAGTFTTHSQMAEQFDVSVNGSNGEICKGYWWELLFPHIGKRGHFDARTIAAGRFATEPEVAGLLAESPSESLTDLFTGIIRRANAGLENHPNTAQLDNVYLTLRMQRWQGRISSATNRIWPSVSPFTFRGPMEAALASPPAQRVRNRLSRQLIERFHPKLAALPLAQGYPALPLRISTAHRFWPLATEFGRTVQRHIRRRLGLSRPGAPISFYAFPLTDLWQQEEIKDLLDVSNMRSRELYETESLKALLEKSKQPLDHGAHRLGRILTLEMLARAIRGVRLA